MEFPKQCHGGKLSSSTGHSESAGGASRLVHFFLSSHRTAGPAESCCSVPSGRTNLSEVYHFLTLKRVVWRGGYLNLFKGSYVSERWLMLFH